MNLELKLSCNICGKEANTIIELRNNKGWEYYCEEHKQTRVIKRDSDLIQRILNRR